MYHAFQHPFLQRMAATGISLHLWELTESLADLTAVLPASLTTQAPFVHFKNERRKREWLATRVLLQQVMGPAYRIDYETNGKPFLVPRSAELSISHTDGWVALATSAAPVGIDIEAVSDRAYKVRHYYLQDEEVASLPADAPDRLATFLWSAKESVYKLVNRAGLELKADIRLQVVQEEAGEISLVARVSGEEQSIIVRGGLYQNFVFTVAYPAKTGKSEEESTIFKEKK